MKYYGARPNIDNLSFTDYPSEDHCLTVFFTGCEHNCPDCQNKELQCLGKVYEELDYKDFVDSLKMTCERLCTNKIALEGGDALHPQNRDLTKRLLDDLHDEYDFIVYTGYEYEDIKDYVENAEFVKTGRYNKTLKQWSGKRDGYVQFASPNQKLYKKGRLVSNDGRYYFKEGK